MNEQSYAQTTQMILAELKTALNAVDPASVEQLLAAVQQADQVFFVGVGRVMLALEAIAKRWAHLGIKTHLVGEITEPAITQNDLLIVGSGSGTTLFCRDRAEGASDRRKGRAYRLQPQQSAA